MESVKHFKSKVKKKKQNCCLSGIVKFWIAGYPRMTDHTKFTFLSGPKELFIVGSPRILSARLTVGLSVGRPISTRHRPPRLENSKSHVCFWNDNKVSLMFNGNPYTHIVYPYNNNYLGYDYINIIYKFVRFARDRQHFHAVSNFLWIYNVKRSLKAVAVQGNSEMRCVRSIRHRSHVIAQNYKKTPLSGERRFASKNVFFFIRNPSIYFRIIVLLTSTGRKKN